MAVVGDASVVVRAITDKVKGDIEKAFRDARPAVQAAGKDHAKAYSDSFSSQLGTSMDRTMSDQFKSSSVNRAASQGGKDNAKAYAGSFSSELGRVDLGSALRNGLGGLSDDAAAIGREAGDAAGRAAGDSSERSFGNAGGRGGRAFRNALDGEFADAAASASSAFTKIYAAGSMLGPAIGGLVGALSAVAGGLFSMASAASVALGALAALPGMVGVAAQAFGGLKLAFMGVGDAVTAGLKPVPAVAKSVGNAGAAAANAVADALRNLSRARVTAAEAAADSARRVADAERDVADAQRDVLQLTKDLTQARLDAAESLQQLGFSAEDAALAQERAAINLEKAQATMDAVNNSPTATDRQKREATLAYKEAELQNREAIDRVNDLKVEQENAAKAGIEGSKEVLDAQDKINKAKDTQADKEQSLADAVKAQSRQRRDSAQQVADAVLALKRAQQQSNKATSQGATAVDAYKEAMKKLSPEAQTFVKYLISIKDEIGKLKAAAGKELFPKLQTSLEGIVQNVFPVLEEQLQTTGGLLGDMAQGFSDAVSEGEGLKRVKRIMENNNEVLKVFSEKGDNGKSTIEELADVFLRLWDAMGPLTERFAIWVDSLVDSADAATDSKDEMQNLVDFFDTAGDRASTLGDIFGNLWDVIVNVGEAADTSGKGLLDSFDEATKKLADFTDKPDNKKKMEKWFRKVADNLRKIGDLIVTAGDELIKLGDNPGIGAFADSLQPAVKNLGDISDNLATASPNLGTFVENVTRLIEATTDSDSLNTFLGILGDVAGFLADIAESKAGGQILKWAGAVAAVTRSFSFLMFIGGLAFKMLIGGPIKVIRKFRSVIDILGRLKGSLKTLRSDGIRAAFAEMRGASDKTIAAFERQMETDKLKVAQLKLVEEQADRTALALGRVKTAGAPGAAAAAAPVKQKMAPKTAEANAAATRNLTAGTPVGGAGAAKNAEKLGASAGKSVGKVKGLGKAVAGLSVALLGITWEIALVIAAIALIILFFVKLYKHSPQFKKFVDGIVDKVKELGKWVGDIFSKYIFPAFDTFFKWVNQYMPVAGDAIAAAFDKIKPVLKVFWKIWSTYFKLIWEFYKTIFDLIVWVVTNVFIPLVKDVIIPTVKFLWEMWSTYFTALWTAASTVFGYVKTGWEGLWNGIKLVLNNVVRPIFATLKKLWNDLWLKVKEVAKNISGKFTDIKTALGKFKTGIGTIIDSIKNQFSSIWTRVSGVFTDIKNKLDDFWAEKGPLKTLLSKITPIVNAITGLFKGIGTVISKAFTGLWDTVKGPLKTFIEMINKYLIGNINKVTSKFGVEIKEISTKGFAEGGYTGKGSKHKVAGLVHADEHVIKAVSRRKLEQKYPGALDHMNKTGMIPRAAIPMGDWGPLGAIAGSIKDKASGAWDSLENLAKTGVGSVLENLVDGLITTMKGAGFKKGLFINDFLYGILDELAGAVKHWGDGKQSEVEAKLAPSGGDTHVNDPSNPKARSTWKGGTFSNLFIAHMKAAEKLAGVAISVIQGGFRPATPYSGTSHQGDAIDLRVSNALIRALRRVGIAAGDRTGLGNWMPHVHAIPGPNAGYGAGSAVWQWQDYMRRGGMSQSLRSPWGLAAGGVALARPGGVHAVIAEAGQNERVEPLDRNGMSKRDQAMLDRLDQAMGEGKNGDNFHVYPSAGMNEHELAMMVSRRVSWRRSVGT